MSGETNMPEVIESEDGDAVFLVGHDVPEVAARIALTAYTAREWALSAAEAFNTGIGAGFERIWMRWPDPLNEEYQVRCGPNDDGAQPLTLMLIEPLIANMDCPVDGQQVSSVLPEAADA